MQSEYIIFAAYTRKLNNELFYRYLYCTYYLLVFSRLQLVILIQKQEFQSLNLAG
jgi:hypothetical protein